MKELIVGLILAAIGGLTFLAYQHPSAFNVVLLPIQAILMIVAIFAAGWDASLFNLETRLHLTETDRKELRGTRLLKLWMAPAFFGAVLYLAFLSQLPKLLGE